MWFALVFVDLKITGQDKQPHLLEIFLMIPHYTLPYSFSIVIFIIIIG